MYIPKIEKRRKELQHREWQYRTIYELLDQGVSIAEISRRINISREWIYHVSRDPECKPVYEENEK